MSKTIATAALALTLLCGTSAMAQDHHGGGGGGGPHGGGGGGESHGGGEPHGGGGSGGFHGAEAHASGGGGQPHFGGEALRGGEASSHGGRGVTPGAGQRTQYSGGGQHHQHGGEAALASGGHGGRPRYNQQAYPHEIHTNRSYQWHGEWNRPSGYYDHHWSYGDHLPFGWYARNFWIDDYWYYNLPDAPYGYAWVREGPDAVLVNRYNGEVVEVDYGVFY